MTVVLVVLPIGDMSIGVIDADVVLELRQVSEDELAEGTVVGVAHLCSVALRVRGGNG